MEWQFVVGAGVLIGSAGPLTNTVNSCVTEPRSTKRRS
jgi:hypothetical protein